MRILLWARDLFQRLGQPDSDTIFIEFPSDEDIELMTDAQVVDLIQSFKFQSIDQSRLKTAISRMRSVPGLGIEETLPLV